MDAILLRPERAAEMLNISRAKLYELLATGRIQSIKLGGSRRIPVAALQRFVDELIAAQSSDER